MHMTHDMIFVHRFFRYTDICKGYMTHCYVTWHFAILYDTLVIQLCMPSGMTIVHRYIGYTNIC